MLAINVDLSFRISPVLKSLTGRNGYLNWPLASSHYCICTALNACHCIELTALAAVDSTSSMHNIKVQEAQEAVEN
jgi:hypothetical protein